MKMNLKEFDYKQFLLEKGERVGLIAAGAVAGLILILSLFMPGKGFFSGSPSTKAEALETSTSTVQRKLSSATPSPKDLPQGEAKDNLIPLDTKPLQAQFYEASGWFEPERGGGLDRRPPIVKKPVESMARVVHLQIDTFDFNKDHSKVTVLVDRGGAAGGPQPGGGAGGGKNNPMAGMMQGAADQMRRRMQGGSGSASPMLKNQQVRLTLRGKPGSEEEESRYQTREIALTDVTASTHCARQLRPVRMAIIAASFPYKEQVEEFKSKLHLSSIQEVLNDLVNEGEGKDKSLAFRFLGVHVQRQELDANNKVVVDWKDIDLAEELRLWLLYTAYPFEEDLSKYDALKPYFDGLVMPRLREFHEEASANVVNMGYGMGSGMGSAAAGSKGGARGDEGTKKESKYPDFEGDLPKIKATLETLAGLEPKKIAVPPERFLRPKTLDPFSSRIPTADSSDQGSTTAQTTPPAGSDLTVPEYCLVRFIDLSIEPGKFYRYRFKVRMANPNYNNPNVASPEYRIRTELEAPDWYVVQDEAKNPITVSVPPELIHYVCDQKTIRDELSPRGYRGMNANATVDPKNQVVFQIHRWIDATQFEGRTSTDLIGDWAVADRVPVWRGEYVGRFLKVELPVWRDTKDAFVLPSSSGKRGQRSRNTGVEVYFGNDNSDRQTILVDFEGGKKSIPLPGAAPGKNALLTDTSDIEVLLLSPDGKLLARNSADDTADEARIQRRKEYYARIAHVQLKALGESGAPSGGLDRPIK